MLDCSPVHLVVQEPLQGSPGHGKLLLKIYLIRLRQPWYNNCKLWVTCLNGYTSIKGSWRQTFRVWEIDGNCVIITFVILLMIATQAVAD